VVVTTPYRGGADCCGHASVSGDCGGHKQCCLSKLWSKLSCFYLDLCGKCGNKCGNGCDTGHKSINLCHKAPACPQPCPPAPVCNPCPPKPVCNPCPKVECPKPCPKVECPKPCPDPCAKPCFSCSDFLRKCKKFFSCCDKGNACPQDPCGSAVIPPATGTFVPAQPVPGTVVPATPVAPAPELRKMPQKVGSSYNPVNQASTPASAPRTIDLNLPF
jgi:hypothetical protein